MLTHFVPSACNGHRLGLALCGRIVRPQFEHAADPTCPRCAQLVQHDDELAAALLAREQAEQGATS